MAPAGSGKTEVLIQRVIRTLERSAGEAFRLLVVTFTVKAAEELKQRARDSIADELWRVDADTIHGFSLDWLRRYGRDVGIDPDVVVLSDDIDRLAVIAGYLRSVGLSDNFDDGGGVGMHDLLKKIDSHRTRHAGGDDDCNRGYRYGGVSLEELADAYGAALKAQGAIDFPGMLLNMVELVDEDQWVLEHFRTLYRDILVDEGQDLTAIQSGLLKRLAGDSINVFVVADDRQSIRGFAGGAFVHAKALVPAAVRAPLQLHHNFRCATKILEAAEAVLRAGGGERQVVAREGAPPGKVTIVPKASAEREADWIAVWISKLLEGGLSGDTVAEGEDPSVVPEDIAVAARTRWALGPVIEALAARSIEFVVQTDARVFLTEPEARLFVDALSLGVNNRDFPAGRRIRDELRELTGNELPEDPMEALHSVENEALASLADLVARALRGGDDLERVMEGLGETGKVGGWAEGATRLSEVWKDYRTGARVQDRSPQGYLMHLAKALRTRPTDPGVRLLTIDRAKGLEFKAVGLVGVRDGQLPDYRATTARERREECRRLYVAMTRAARELVITWPTSTEDRYGRIWRQSPSRFLVSAGLVEADAAAM